MAFYYYYYVIGGMVCYMGQGMLLGAGYVIRGRVCYMMMMTMMMMMLYGAGYVNWGRWGSIMWKGAWAVTQSLHPGGCGRGMGCYPKPKPRWVW